MEAFISLFMNDPIKGAAVGLLILVAWFIKRDYARRDSQFTAFQDKLARWETSVKHHMKETVTSLRTHSDDLGKATKAVNGDMLKIREQFFELKTELIDKIEEQRHFASHLERHAQALAQTMDLTIEKFEEKFGRLIHFKKELELAHGKIIKIEEANGKATVDIANVHRWIKETVNPVLQKHREEIEKLKTQTRKNPDEV